MYKYLIPAILLLSLTVTAQNNKSGDDCATKPTQFIRPDMSLLQQSRAQAASFMLKIFIHICADDNGNNLAVNNATAFNQYIQGTRDFYANSDICFLLMGVDTIRSTALNYMVTDNNSDYNLLVNSRVPGSINVFFHTSLMEADGTTYNGNAYDIPSNFCSVRGSLVGTTNTSTLAHELGHVFGLYHTFETSMGAEVVPRSGNQSNCSNAGDLLCGTAADPNPDPSTINASCIYTGNAKDALGNLYTPPVRNLLTYGRFECRNMFTTDQNDRMHVFFILPGGPSGSVAPDNLNLGTNTTISSNTHAYGARNNITIVQNTNFVINGSARVHFKVGNNIVFKPGVVFQPGASGFTIAGIEDTCP